MIDFGNIQIEPIDMTKDFSQLDPTKLYQFGNLPMFALGNKDVVIIYTYIRCQFVDATPEGTEMMMTTLAKIDVQGNKIYISKYLVDYGGEERELFNLLLRIYLKWHYAEIVVEQVPTL